MPEERIKHGPRFDKEADSVLDQLYTPVGASTTREKITVLQRALGGTFNFYALGGNPTDEMKLACLEYHYLEKLGKIDLVRA